VVEFNKDGYQLVEEWSFSDAIENGVTIDVQQAYEAIGPITYALQRNPEAFPVAHGHVRVAHLEERPLDDLPGFRVFFRISLHHKTVYLLFVDHG